MRLNSWFPATAAVAFAVAGAVELRAQGVTTGAVGGRVSDPANVGIEGAQIQVTNRATGFSSGAVSRDDGRFFVQGLEVGGPYTIIVRRIGTAPRTIENVRVALSQTTRVDVTLEPQATELTGVTVTAARGESEISPTSRGTRTTVSDTALQRLPTVNRNLTEFIRLTPQVSTSGAGFSGGGMSNRMNNVQIDGSTERDAFGLGSTGQPGAQANSRSVSIEAVKEFQVLLAPYDVRQGNFGGLLLNAVTKSGTNDFTGSAFYVYRNEKFGADTSILRATPFDRKQFGFTLGGPIVRDRLHFFLAPEFQQQESPLSGPFLGQPTGNTIGFGADSAAVNRFTSLLAEKGLQSPGTAGFVNVPNPLNNVFGRLDWRISDVHRAVFRYNYSDAELLRTQTGRSATNVVLSSNLHDFRSVKQAPVLQLYSNFRNGASNELFLGFNSVRDRRVPPTTFPQISANLATTSGVRFIAGAEQFSQTNELDQDIYELTNNFTFAPRGNHTITVGTRNEFARYRNQFNQSSYGVWSFRDLDSLAAGNANSFRRAIVLRDQGNVYFDALQSAAYLQDQWAVTPRLNVTLGARADVTGVLSDNPYNAAIDSAYGRRTDDTPGTKVQFSPRVGFNWDVTGDQRNQLRGGAGFFVGTPPAVWIENAYINNGSIITFLNCNTSGSSDPAPTFTTDVESITSCRNGRGARPIGAVNFVSSDLSFPQPFRANLAYDRQLPFGVVGTLEGLFSKTRNQFFFTNLNVAGPVGTDRYGRVLYGTIDAQGRSNVTLPATVAANGGGSRFSEAFDMQNQNKDYAYNLTGQLRKRFTGRYEGQAAYTFSRARDVQSFGSSTHISNWRFGRTLSGRQEDVFLGTSLFDQPHKILVSGTYSLPIKSFTTDISVIYQGVSGSPHDYIYDASGARTGDLNADGFQGNDLIYVPRNAADASEARFRDITRRVGTGAAARDSVVVAAFDQAVAFEQFIQSSECLSEQRGKILTRNSCRLPFSNQVDLAIQQTIPAFRGQRVALRLDLFNFGNLLNKDWGKQQVSPLGTNSNIPLLTHVGQTSTDVATAQPIVTFDPNRAPSQYVNGNFVDNFWRTQLSLRLSF